MWCLSTHSQIFTVTYRKPHFFINVNKWILSTAFPHTVIKIHAGQPSEVTGTSLAPEFCSICEISEVRRILCALCVGSHTCGLFSTFVWCNSQCPWLSMPCTTLLEWCVLGICTLLHWFWLFCNVNLQSTFCKRRRKWVMLWHHRNQLSSFYLTLIEGCFCCQVIYTSELPWCINQECLLH